MAKVFSLNLFPLLRSAPFHLFSAVRIPIVRLVVRNTTYPKLQRTDGIIIDVEIRSHRLLNNHLVAGADFVRRLNQERDRFGSTATAESA